MTDEQTLCRRNLLSFAGTVTVAGLAGCISSGVSDDTARETDEAGGGSVDGGTQTELTDILQIEDHEWLAASILEVTVRNIIDDTLDLVQVEADVYVGDERTNHAYTNISSLPAGTVETSEIQFTESYDRNPREADRYDLVPNFYYDGEDYEERIEYEFNPEFYE